MSTSAQDEQHERRRVFAQDQSVRNQGGTMHAFAISDAATPRGRFSEVNAAYVVGSKPTISYPAASSAHQTELPPEPPTGYRIDAMPDFDPGPDVSPAQQLPNPASAVAPSSPVDVERRDVGLGLSQTSGDPAGVHFPSPPVTSRDVHVGSPPLRRF